MANKSQSTFLKRQKELARHARRKDKQARRLEKKADASADPQADSTIEDPDLAGISLGPQPPADEVETGGDEDPGHAA